MQRKDIDETEFADLRSAIVDAEVSPGDITTVAGRHVAYGPMILVAAGNTFAMLGNDVDLIVGKDETLESEMAVPA